jgi:hypothetical protein
VGLQTVRVCLLNLRASAYTDEPQHQCALIALSAEEHVGGISQLVSSPGGRFMAHTERDSGWL